jgi:hypothetical protein
MSDAESRLEAKLDQLAREMRNLRRVIVACTTAVCFVLVGGRDAGAVLFMVAFVGVCAYTLQDCIIARRRMMANLRESRSSQGGSAE